MYQPAVAGPPPTPPTTTAAAISPHLADPALAPFLQPDFDPADYLNTILPPLSITTNTTTATRSSSTPSARPATLPDLSAQLQTLLTRLNAQTSRLSNALTQLTDEIIRSGGRLAYEVEVLRGETKSLTDTLTNPLKKDIDLFTTPANPNPEAKDPTAGEASTLSAASDEPPHLTHLRTLTLTRARLDAVIRTFGTALSWPLPPSHTRSTALLAITPPSENAAETAAREQKGQAYITDLRNEITGLLDQGGAEGVEAAGARVAELAELVGLWRGTAEEGARGKVVEGLGKLVEERRRAVGEAGKGRGDAGRERMEAGKLPRGGMDYRYGGGAGGEVGGRGADGGYGFFRGLKNLGSEMYLD